MLFFCTCLLSCLKCTCNCAHILVRESMLRRVLPLMVAVMANSRPDQTITITSFWTCGHTHTHFAHLMVVNVALPFVHTHNLLVRLFHPFSKESTLTLTLVYGLPTLLLLYVCPLEAITAQTSELRPTFSQFHRLWSKSWLVRVKYALYTKKKQVT